MKQHTGYYEPILHAIIGNARKNLLIITNAMSALLFSVLPNTDMHSGFS